MTSGWVARMRCSGLATMASISGVVRWSANWRLKVGGHGIGPELKGKDAVGTLDAFLGRGNLQDRANRGSTKIKSGHFRRAVTDGMADRTPNLRAS